MSNQTHVVITCTQPGFGAGPRILSALEDYTQAHHRASAFEPGTPTQPYIDGLHDAVYIGTVNHLDPDNLLLRLRDAAQDRAYRSDYAPLVVLLRNEYSDLPVLHVLDNKGTWTTPTTAPSSATGGSRP